MLLWNKLTTDRQTDRQTSKFCPFFNSINNKQNAQIIQL